MRGKISCEIDVVDVVDFFEVSKGKKEEPFARFEMVEFDEQRTLAKNNSEQPEKTKDREKKGTKGKRVRKTEDEAGRGRVQQSRAEKR